MANHDKDHIQSMLTCLYNHISKHNGLVESVEIFDTEGGAYTHLVKVVFTRLIQSNEHVPSRFIMPYVHMFEAIGLFIYFGRSKNGMSNYSMESFNYKPSGHYLPPFTGLYNKIHMATEKWAFSVSNVLDSQHHAERQHDAIKLELLRKVPMTV